MRSRGRYRALRGALVGAISMSFASLALALPQDGCTVWGVPRTTPSADFTPLDDGAILRHEMTGLEWQRCPLGQEWDGAACTGTVLRLNWQEALQAAAAAGDDWRLPSIRELYTIVELCRIPAINLVAFPLEPPTVGHDVSFWSASPGADGGAWVVSFHLGDVGRGGVNQSYPVRLVRGGE